MFAHRRKGGCRAADWPTSTPDTPNYPTLSTPDAVRGGRAGPANHPKSRRSPRPDREHRKRLIESIDDKTLVGLRDRALIGVMVYSFSRVSAAVGMDLDSLVRTAGRSWLRLSEKGGKVHEMPVHHRLLEHLEAYIAALGDEIDPKGPLFRAARGRTGALSVERMTRHDAYAMVRRRAVKAGVVEKIGNHSFRGTGITTFLMNEGTLEQAQGMANHSSPRTTKLYDRRGDKITQDAVERIRIE
ncbi:MAG: tyrosine-type recombinase/integrase [Caulobacteraceae bacterium]